MPQKNFMGVAGQSVRSAYYVSARVVGVIRCPDSGEATFAIRSDTFNFIPEDKPCLGVGFKVEVDHDGFLGGMKP